MASCIDREVVGCDRVVIACDEGDVTRCGHILCHSERTQGPDVHSAACIADRIGEARDVCKGEGACIHDLD
jgi:hypothetical protein